jgi:heme-degrading monooxygenase HmoA
VGDDIAALPEPPYWAVIFTSVRHDPRPDDGYAETAARMFALAAEQPGYLGVESAREGLGITVAYFRDEESTRAWTAHADHLVAQERGRSDWYARYAVRVARVERAYRWDRPTP